MLRKESPVAETAPKSCVQKANLETLWYIEYIVVIPGNITFQFLPWHRRQMLGRLTEQGGEAVHCGVWAQFSQTVEWHGGALNLAQCIHALPLPLPTLRGGAREARGLNKVPGRAQTLPNTS